jgi:hypothetical protein
MADFVESAKNFVNAAVSRTGWEAQKQLRLRNKQSEIDKLLDQRQQLLNDVAMNAMNLYTQGTLSDPQLSRLCASILELDHDVKSRETQLQDIKNEGYPADQFTPNPTTNYTPPPTSGFSSSAQSGTPPPSSGGFSSNAGTPPPSSGGSQAQGQQRCPNCNSPLRPNALYCRSCGAKLR